ncbi:hypothetical protein L5515_007803 [Caenorhabditis briggsae]|uniref:Zinc metalloproteinase n=1 Tax=Caenorhabditis briggsae TaxID=6238 RepID=A0AAE9EZL0_CAEBR|nr:hypothetical protein L5515_007803 [Caenorhabditis briggsae]
MFRSLLISILLIHDIFSENVVLNFGSHNKHSHGSRAKRQVIIRGEDQDQYKWPNNTVHYYFDEENFDFSMKETILQAMKMLSSHTCIKFSTEPSDVIIRMESDSDRNYCFSEIGHVRENQQFSFTSSCYSVGLAVHEIIHSLGFMHAHQRADRDEYLHFVMDLDGMSLQDRQQYAIWEHQILLVPYDYGSVMQYADADDNYFPINKNRFMYQTMGSEVVAFYDYLMINKYYECSCGDDALKCQNFGYPNPSNCSQCNCPYGFGGDDCSQRAEPGTTLQATKGWKNTTISLDAGFKDVNHLRMRQIDYIYSYLWITAPENKTTEIRVLQSESGKCFRGCGRGAIEIKTNEDPRLTSPRFCCNESKTVRSSHTPTVVMAYNSEGLNEYTIAYRYVDTYQ